MARTTLDLVSDALQGITLQQIAQEAGISLAALRQYRLPVGARGRRNPSPGAQEAITRAIGQIAKAQVSRFSRIVLEAQKRP